jgi:phage-related protein
MLDNLKLGYGGTQKEMYRLLQDAQKIDETFDAVFYIDDQGHLTAQYADIVEAIHIVQTEMGITGTTALEASETISGSVASMKSAWQNLVTGIADENANFDVLISNFVESVGTAADNILPRIEKALGGIGLLIERLSPIIIENLPSLVETVVPSFLKAATQIVTAVADVLPELIEVLVPIIAEQAPIIIKAGFELSKALTSGLFQALADPEVINQIFNTIVEIGKIMINRRAEMVKTAISLISSLASGLVENAEKIIPTIQAFIEKIASFIGEKVDIFADSAVTIIKTIGKFLTSNVESLTSFVQEFVIALADVIAYFAPLLLDSAIELVESIGQGLVDNAEKILGAVASFVGKVVEFVTNRENLITIASVAIRFIEEIATSLINNVADILPTIISVVAEIAEMLIDPTVLNPILDAALNIIMALANGLTESLPEIIDIVVGIITYIVDVLTDEQILNDLLDAAVAILTALADLIVESLPKLAEASNAIIIKLVEFLTDPETLTKLGEAAIQIVVELGSALGESAFKLSTPAGLLSNVIIQSIKKSEWGQTGKDIVASIWEGIKEMWKKLSLWFDEKIDGIVGGFEDAVNTIKRILGISTDDNSIGNKNVGGGSFGTSQAQIGASGGMVGNAAMGGVTVNQYIYAQPQSAADLAQETQWEAERGVLQAIAVGGR